MSETAIKRPRGRPRKHPLPAPLIVQRADLSPEDDPAHDLDGPDPFSGPPATVYFQRKAAAFGDAPNPGVEITWPYGWALPQSGDQIRIGPQSGFVTHITYLPLEGRVVINTR